MLPTKIKDLRSRAALLAVTAFVLTFLVAACGGSNPTATQPVTLPESTSIIVAPATPAEVRTSEVIASADNSAPVETPAPEPSVIAKLDADAVVEAQEQVMINIYQNLLPSVVHIRVSTRIDISPSIPRLPLPQDPRDFFQQGEGSGFIGTMKGTSLPITM